MVGSFLNAVSHMKNIKYAPKLAAAISYFVLLALVAILFMGRTTAFARIDLLAGIFPNFYHHISNFCISYLLFSGVGYSWLMLGMKFKYVVALGIAVLLANFVYELFINVLNTPDIIDAYYGFWGTMAAFAFLWLLKNYGLTKSSLVAEETRWEERHT